MDIESFPRDQQYAEQSRQPTLEAFWGDEDDGSDELEPLIEGFFFQKSLAGLYGPYGEGKSFVALDIALHVATGQPWFGRRVRQGAVLYVAPEGYHGLKRRRAAWCRHHGLKRTPSNFALVRGSLNLQRPDGVTLEHLAQESRSRQAKLIILDTLNAVFGGGDENDSAAMSKARHELERLRDLSGATVLIVHHAGKDLDRGLRGSSVLGAALDTALCIHGKRIISGAPKGKQKDCEPADEIAFALRTIELGEDTEGQPITSAVVVTDATEKFAASVNLSNREAHLYKILKQEDRFFGSPTREHLRQTLRRLKWGPEGEDDAWRQAFRRGLNGLRDKGMIEFDGDRIVPRLIN